MILHIFNADNDMALAMGEAGYTAPASIRKMMRQTELLPSRWARPGEGIVVHNGVWLVEEPAPKKSLWEESLCLTPESTEEQVGRGRLMTFAEAIPLVAEVRPWGWSPAVCHRLRGLGVSDDLLPSPQQLSEIRRLSSRERAVELLQVLVEEDHQTSTSDICHECSTEVLLPDSKASECFRLKGESVFCNTIEAVDEALNRWPQTILKAPWSGSGKGLRYGQGGREATLSGWCRRILSQQGGVVVEPFYEKQCDFAMEFWSDGGGCVTYRGLSVFETHPNGAYCGNKLWPEQQKQDWLCQQIGGPAMTFMKKSQIALQLDTFVQRIETHLSALIKSNYKGPLGVDMMVLKGGFVHPCVEINLRMTMGFASLI